MDFGKMMEDLPAMLEAGNNVSGTLERIAVAVETIAASLNQLTVLIADEVNYGKFKPDPGDHHIYPKPDDTL